MNINLHELVKKVPAKGVLHVGANTCQELELYKSFGFEHRLWIEPITDLEFPEGETIIHTLIGEYCGDAPFHKALNNNESSSVLKPNKHLEKYPNIDFKPSYELIRITTLEHLLSTQGVIRVDFNYLVLDIQGAELSALKGLGAFSQYFEVIITEAYTEELYHGCGKVREIIEHLKDYQLVEMGDEVGKGWCDLAFIRKDLIK